MLSRRSSAYGGDQHIEQGSEAPRRVQHRAIWKVSVTVCQHPRGKGGESALATQAAAPIQQPNSARMPGTRTTIQELTGKGGGD